MAKSTGKDYRKGSANDRSQAHNPKTDNLTKHDAKSSVADQKMMRAWNTISENRNGAKRKH